MPGTGIMEQIRTLLSQSKSSTEVIKLGFRPATVYKVQRQMAEGGMADGPPGENPQARNHELPGASKVGIRHNIETPDPQVEADPDIVQLKIDLRKAQLRQQLGEVEATTELESRVVTLENRVEEIFAEFRALEPNVYSSPLVGFREEYQCSCGAEDQVAARVVCLNCGETEEYSWWTRIRQG